MIRLLLALTLLSSVMVCTATAGVCGWEEEAPGSAVATISYSVQGSTVVSLAGLLKDMRGRTTVYVSMTVGTTARCSDFETDRQSMLGTGQWTSIAAGLQPNSEYYFRARAEYSGNPTEIRYGKVGNFKTPP